MLCRRQGSLKKAVGGCVKIFPNEAGEIWGMGTVYKIYQRPIILTSMLEAQVDLISGSYPILPGQGKIAALGAKTGDMEGKAKGSNSQRRGKVGEMPLCTRYLEYSLSDSSLKGRACRHMQTPQPTRRC